MQEMIGKLMANKYWNLLRMEAGGNRILRIMAHPGSAWGNDFLWESHFLQLVMMGFYPLSYSILEAFRVIEELAPNDAIRSKVRFFVEVEEGKQAASDWYRNVSRSELFRRLFSSLSPGTTPITVDEEMLGQYLGALRLREGGLVRALVTATFIEKTGMYVLQLLHDFVAQWQTLAGLSTSKVDLTYLNEHMLHEGEGSEDQHVNLITNLVEECGPLDFGNEIRHFEAVTAKWLNHTHDCVYGILRSR